jgi:hypothetical protein
MADFLALGLLRMPIIVTRRLDGRAPAFYTRNSSQAVFIRHVGENLYYCFSNGY